MSKKSDQELGASVRRYNGLVALVHLTSFTTLLILSIVFFDDAKQVRLWTDFGGVNIQPRGSVRLLYTLLPFPLITGLIHLAIYLFDVDNYKYNVLVRGVNRLRWIEYAITNGLMTWSVTLLAGAGSLLFPIVAVLSNLFMQFCGYAHEWYNHNRIKGHRSLWFLAVGFVPWIINWLIALTYFFERAAREGASVYDWLAIVGTFVWSLAFVVPLVWRFYQDNTRKNNYYVELAYIFLSLSAKLWLDWVVISESF